MRDEEHQKNGKGICRNREEEADGSLNFMPPPARCGSYTPGIAGWNEGQSIQVQSYQVLYCIELGYVFDLVEFSLELSVSSACASGIIAK
jgi:hypothetical protein